MKATRLVFSRFLDLHGNLGIVKEKPTRKTCFFHEKKCLAPRIYQAKFCLPAFLWSQRNLYYIFTSNRCSNEGEYICKGLIIKKVYKRFIKVHKSSIKALRKLYKSFIKDSLWKLYKSFTKKLMLTCFKENMFTF